MKLRVADLLIARKSRWMITHWLEAAIIVFLFIGIGVVGNPLDPLFLKSSFPWSLLSLILVPLRYGIVKGIFANVIVICALFYFEAEVTIQISYYAHYIFASILITLICGEFHTAWTTRIKNAEGLNEYIASRFENLSRAYFITRLSHIRLEQSLINKPTSLRDTIERIRNLMLESTNVEFDHEIASFFLSLVSEYCAFEQAALFAYKDGNFEEKSLAYIGHDFTLNRDDTLIQHCFDNKDDSFSAVNYLEDQQHSEYLVTALVRQTSGNLVAMLVVKDMSFWSLQDNTLKILSVLIDYFCHTALVDRRNESLLDAYPDCPTEFSDELDRLVQLHKHIGIDSIMFLFSIDNGDLQEALASEVEIQKRSLDYMWTKKEKGRVIIILLMPFTNPKEVDPYFRRMKTALADKFGVKLGQSPIRSRFLEISSKPMTEQVKNLLEHLDNNA